MNCLAVLTLTISFVNVDSGQPLRSRVLEFLVPKSNYQFKSVPTDKNLPLGPRLSRPAAGPRSEIVGIILKNLIKIKKKPAVV